MRINIMQLTHNDVLRIIELLRVNYDNAYSGYNNEQTITLLDFWYESLKDYPKEVVFESVKNLIIKNEFAPRLANIIEEIERLISPDQKTDEQLWAELSAVFGKVYDISRYLTYPQYVNWANAKLNEIYSKLSDELKLFVVNVSTLVDIAEMSDESLQFERARFFKQMPQLKKHGAQKAAAQKFLEQTKTQQALPQPKKK